MVSGTNNKCKTLITLFSSLHEITEILENEPSVSSYPVPRSTLGTEDGDVGRGSGPRLGSVQGDDWEHASPAVVSEVLQATHPAEEKEGCRCRAAR